VPNAFAISHWETEVLGFDAIHPRNPELKWRVSSMMTIILANSNIVEVSPAAGSFIVLSAISVVLLWIVPHAFRCYVLQVGTYCHELCHGVASLVTGGKFCQFRVHSRGGGRCLTSGGNSKIITPAGYVGTVVIGAICLARSVYHGQLTGVLQITAVLLAISTIKAGDLYTAIVGIVTAAVLGLSALWPDAAAARITMNLMGVILVWQGFEALKTLWAISASQRDTGSDAETMPRLTGRSAMHWALVFGGIALVVFLAIIGLSVRAGVPTP